MTTSTSLRLLAICGFVAALSLLRFTPTVDFLHPEIGIGYGVMRVPAMLHQLDHPTGWDDPVIPTALRWRLLPPTFGRLLGLRPASYLALPLLGILILLATVAHYTFQATQRPGAAACAVVLVATSSAFFVATGWLGQFDVFYLLGLVIATCSPGPLATWAACTLAPWCDERFLLLLPACLVLKWAVTKPPRPRVHLAVALLGVAPYLALRLWALRQGEASVGEQIAIQTKAYGAYLPWVPAGWWMGFRTGWVLVGLGFWAAWRALPRPGRWCLLLALGAGLGLVTLLAWDVSRSIVVLLPFGLCGVIAAVNRWPRNGVKIMMVVLGLNFLLPASHVVENHRIPIRSALPRLFHRPR